MRTKLLASFWASSRENGAMAKFESQIRSTAAVNAPEKNCYRARYEVNRSGGVGVLCFVMFVSVAALVLFAAEVFGAPEVPYVTVVADNPVDGVRALASRKGESFQVFLWRAQHYLDDVFRTTSFEEIRSILEKHGAKQIQEWGTQEGSDLHVVRYAVLERVIKSRVGKAYTCVIEVRHAPKAPVANQIQTSVVILSEFGIDFKAAAAQRDFPKGTVLDRVFGLIDLEKRAKETSRLETIEISYGEIGYLSTRGLGMGFHLEVAQSNPTSHGHLADQTVYYMACSGLDPLGGLNVSDQNKAKARIHVARDTLIPGAALEDLHEHGYPDTFGSIGSRESPR
jgi:hypothetical protein